MIKIQLAPHHRFLSILLPLFLPVLLSAQKSVSYFSDNMQKTSNSRTICVQQKDKFFYVGGQSFDETNYYYTPTVVKLDSNGQTIWTYSLNKQIDTAENSYQASFYAFGYIQKMVVDDHFVYAYCYGMGNRIQEIWKIDQQTGSLIWKRTTQSIDQLAIADSNRIACTYNGLTDYRYDLIDKTTGRTTYSIPIQPKPFVIDSIGGVYFFQGDSVIKYQDPELTMQSWANKTNCPGAITALMNPTDGNLYMLGYGGNIFAGKLDRYTGAVSWITTSAAVADDHVSDAKVVGGFLYLSGQHNYFGSVYAVVHICKMNSFTGQMAWESTYNPDPYLSGGYYSANTLDVDANGSVFASGYDEGNDNRTGIWGITKFNTSGALMYHKTVFEGPSYASSFSRGVYTTVMGNHVIHIGDLQRNATPPATNYNGGYSFLYFLSTDTSDSYNPNIARRGDVTYQEFSDVKAIQNFSSDRYLVLKQTGFSATVEMHSSVNGSTLWTKNIQRDFYFEADKLSITADNKILISAFSHGGYEMKYDHKGLPDLVYFIRLDSNGNQVQEQTYDMSGVGNFKSVQLYSNRDTNNIYVYSKWDNNNNPISLQFLNLDRGSGSIQSGFGTLGAQYNPLQADQHMILPFDGDSAGTLQNRPPATATSHVVYDVLTFKQNFLAGWTISDFNLTDMAVIPSDMAVADSGSMVIAGRLYPDIAQLIRFNTRERKTIWSLSVPGYSFDMVSGTPNDAYVTGRKNDQLVIRRYHVSDGTQVWEKTFAPAGPNQYYIPTDQKYNSFRGQYTVAGYIADSSTIQETQTAFYITLDVNGNIIRQWSQSGEYNKRNALSIVHITQFGQTLIGGALNKMATGHSGIFIEADSALSQTNPPLKPQISLSPSVDICAGDSVLLEANAPGCINCQYAWSNSTDPNNPQTVVKQSGTYTVTVTNSFGSASASEVINVHAIPAKPSISASGNILHSSAANGNQWFINGNIIAGANASQYLADSTGNYTVSETENGCPGPYSDPLAYEKNPSPDSVSNQGFKFYPNPVTDVFHIVNNQSRALTIRIFSADGRSFPGQESSQPDIVLNFRSMAKGAYYITILDKKINQTTVTKVIKL
jgi:Secretion system C-terminal sorting domain/PQQ-like domain